MLEKLNMDLVYLTLWLSIGILLAFGGIIYTLMTIQEKFEMFKNGLNFICNEIDDIHSKLNDLVSKHTGNIPNLSEEEEAFIEDSNEPKNDSSEPKNYNDILDADLISVLESKSPDSQSFRIRAQVH